MESSLPGQRASGTTQSDGQMEFGHYSDAQLRDLQLVLDSQRYPLNAARLRAELDRRATRAPADKSGDDHAEQRVRFTAADGWRGWWQAMRRRSLFFGEGTIEVSDDKLLLSGWRRNWLASADRREKCIALDRIRNAAADGALLSFEYRRRIGFWKRVSVGCKSEAIANSLLRQLPQRRSPGFDRWTALRAYTRRLENTGRRPRVTVALAILNTLVFLACILVHRAWAGLTWSDLLNWGANYGPLTLSSQWWRLLTALFLHGGFFHLAVNLWVLWNAGLLTEKLFGSGRYALIYLGSGLLANMASILWKPSAISVGASGAIFGVLGAFLAYAMAPRTRLPLRVLRTLWLSTAVFALFSLVNGMLSQGIDNAAHVGGLLSGLLLGIVLARPLPDARESETVRPRERLWPGLIFAMALVAGLLFAGIWQVQGLRERVTPPTAFLKSHEWMAAGEQKNLASWARIGNGLGTGALSPAEFGRQFKSEILPFWEDAKQRLDKEMDTLPRDQLPYAKDMQFYLDTRVGFIRDMIDTVENGTITPAQVQEHVAEVQRALARLERRRLNADADLAPQSLANASWVLRLRHFFGGGDRCVEPPAWTGRASGQHDQKSDGPAQRHAIQCSAQQAFKARDFSGLQGMLESYPPADADPIEGLTRHASVYNGLSDMFEYANFDPNESLAAIAAWKRQYPRSIAPALVESTMYISSAWAARGGGYAREVSEQQWQLFNVRLAMARAALDDVKASAASDPEWFVLRLLIGKGMSDPRSEMGRDYSAGIRNYPYYLPLVVAWLNNLMPRWGGTFEEVDALIKAHAQKMRNSADEAYARLYSMYSDMEGDEEDFYKQGLMDWPRMQAGFSGLLERYPNSDYILNSYAYLACRAGKKEDFHVLRPRLEGHVASTAWGIQHTLEWCDKHMH